MDASTGRPWHCAVVFTDAAGAAVLAKIPERTEARPILIGIDGLGGAGKTTLADAIAEARRHVQVVHGDDFYGPEERDWRSWTAQQGYERYFDHQRLASELLEPLRDGRPGRFQRYDWGQNTLGEWVDVTPHGVVVVEGVYLLRPELRPAWDVTVFVEVPRDVRAARLHARGQNDAGWIDRWMAAEDYYEQVLDPAGLADLVVPGV
jgi:uridine kinase